MEHTKEGSFEEATGVWKTSRTPPMFTSFEDAARDILTYATKDIVKMMILEMDPISFARICGMDTRLREICQPLDFQKMYFNKHEKEVLDVLTSILQSWDRSNKISKSELDYYMKWSKIAGAKWKPRSVGKGPRSGWIVFSTANKRKVMKELGLAKYGEVTEILVSKWKKMTTKQKKPYTDIANMSKKLYRIK